MARKSKLVKEVERELEAHRELEKKYNCKCELIWDNSSDSLGLISPEGITMCGGWEVEELDIKMQKLKSMKQFWDAEGKYIGDNTVRMAVDRWYKEEILGMEDVE